MPMDRSASVLGPIRIHATMGSFKLRLVTYFLLLALLPLAAAAWAFNEVAQRSERGSADSRLLTALRVAQVDYAEKTDHAGSDASSLSRASQVQSAFLENDRSAFVRLANEIPHASFYSREGRLAGDGPPDLRNDTPRRRPLPLRCVARLGRGLRAPGRKNPRESSGSSRAGNAGSVCGRA